MLPTPSRASPPTASTPSTPTSGPTPIHRHPRPPDRPRHSLRHTQPRRQRDRLQGPMATTQQRHPFQHPYHNRIRQIGQPIASNRPAPPVHRLSEVHHPHPSATSLPPSHSLALATAFHLHLTYIYPLFYLSNINKKQTKCKLNANQMAKQREGLCLPTPGLGAVDGYAFKRQIRSLTFVWQPEMEDKATGRWAGI